MNKKSQSKAMSVFKLLMRNLRKLIFLGGMLPCTLQIDNAHLNESKNNFKLFSVYFPLTWWFIVLLVAQLGYVVMVVYELIDWIHDKIAENDSHSSMLAIISVVSDVTLLLISFVPRLLIFRSVNLRAAIISISEVDQQFNKGYEKICNSHKRINMGAFVTVAWVAINLLYRKGLSSLAYFFYFNYYYYD